MELKGKDSNVLNDKKLKESPFSVPDGYFDTLPGQIQAKISERKAVKRALIPVALRTQLAFAAGFAFMVVVAYFGYYVAQPLFTGSQEQQQTDYVEIVSRSISQFDDIDLYSAVKNKQKKDSLRARRCLQERYYRRSRNCFSIIEEKREIKP